MKDLLQNEIDLWAKLGHPAIMQRFVLAKGKAHQSQSLPKPFKRMEMKNCFQNAHRLMLKTLTYVEGYGVRPMLGMLFHHAWVIDPMGRVIDPTWDDPESCQYYGVEFSRFAVVEEMDRTGYYGLLDTVGINMDLIRRLYPEIDAQIDAVRNRKTVFDTLGI